MKIFISYHLANQNNVDKIRRKLSDAGINFYSVPEDSNFNGWSQQQISDYLIKEMEKCQILLCVVGNETYSRPHVDYELHHSLKGGPGKRLGWIVSLLEERGDSIYNIDYDTYPNRIQDNEHYALLVQNGSLMDYINQLIIDANELRSDPNVEVDNTRNCMPLPRRKYYDEL